MRFVRRVNFNGPAPTLVAHLIDGSDASTVTGARLDLTGATGGTNRISNGSVTLTHNVTAIDDARWRSRTWSARPRTRWAPPAIC